MINFKLALILLTGIFTSPGAPAADFTATTERTLAREWARDQRRGVVDVWSASLADALDRWAALKEISYEVQRNEAADRVAKTMTEWCHGLAVARAARVNRARAARVTQLLNGLVQRALAQPPKIEPFAADLRARLSGALDWVPSPDALPNWLSNWNIFSRPRPNEPANTMALVILAGVKSNLGPSGAGFILHR